MDWLKERKPPPFRICVIHPSRNPQSYPLKHESVNGTLFHHFLPYRLILTQSGAYGFLFLTDETHRRFYARGKTQGKNAPTETSSPVQIDCTIISAKSPYQSLFNSYKEYPLSQNPGPVPPGTYSLCSLTNRIFWLWDCPP